jgi:hypothetical protein
MGAAASAVGYHASEDHVHKGHATTIREKLDELAARHLPEEEFHREMKEFFMSLHPPDWQHPDLKEQTVRTHHHHAQVHHQHMTHAAEGAAHSALNQEERHALEEQIKEANKKRHEGEHAHNHKGEDKSHHHHHHHHKHDGEKEEDGNTDVEKETPWVLSSSIAADPTQEGAQPTSEP